MLVLGLNYGDHDPSAALVKDGRLLVVVEHERISRIKRGKYQVPTESILECLKATGTNPSDIDYIAVGWSDQRLGELGEADKRFRIENVLPGEFRQVQELPQIVGVRHHLAHAASAFWCSGFSEAAVLVVDGEGEDESTTLWSGTEKGLVEIASLPSTLSLGHFYKSATKFSGLEHDGGNHEGKLMGLSSYGRPTEPMPLVLSPGSIGFSSDVAVDDGPRIRERFRDRLHEFWRASAYPYIEGDGREVMAYANFATSVQSSLEGALVHLAEHLKLKTGFSRLAIAGGVGQNCAANGTLGAKRIFDEIYIQPACHDAGVSLGAALWVSHTHDPNSLTIESAAMPHAFWGLQYSSDECQAALDKAGLKYVRLSEDALASTVAQAVADGSVVGWFHGRAEIGPRALGARSILADPRKRANVMRVNGIKSREVWRPFAPSVLEEHFDEYFESVVRSPFMNVACPVRYSARRLVPAIVHVDGTARPQSISSKHAPRYWKVVDGFRRITGLPLLLNTSFNLRGEPIVNSPRDAIRDFQISPIDMLALEDCVVTKRAQS